MTRQAYRQHRHRGIAAALGPLWLLYGCQTAMDSSDGPEMTGAALEAEPARPLGAPERGPEVPVATVVDARPAALVNGQAVNWGELRPLLSEAAGAEVLEEIILDRQLRSELGRAGLVVDGDDMSRERKLLLQRLSDDPDLSIRLLRQLRARDRLGPRRFDGLVWRNAALRLLVRDEVEVREEEIKQLHEILYGPRHQVRLMVLPTLVEAQRVIERVEAGERFADVTVEVSTDASAARGGLLEPISRLDPAYPDAIRRSLQWLEQGEMSSPILIDAGYAVLLLERTLPRQDVGMSEVRGQLEDEVRLKAERVYMDRLARRLLNTAPVTIFDDQLHEAWRLRRGLEER